ncbi:MAG: efflux RND transporter permease subunit [Chloroflexota bacterium]|nr:efflux RND transporter permease subunit [Chloroflexota bacterium]
MDWLRAIARLARRRPPVALLATVLTVVAGVLAMLRLQRGSPDHPRPEPALSLPKGPPAPEAVRTDWVTAITRLALRRPAVTFLATILVILAGVFAIFRLQTELFPDINLPVASVVTPYPGASPDAVLENVTVPVENAVAGVGGLQDMQSISAEGLSMVIAQFDYGTDMDQVEREIGSNVNNVALPSGVARPTVTRIDFSDFPVVFLSLLGERDVSELDALAKKEVVPALERLSGVAQVSIEGGAAQQVWVTLDPQKLFQHGLTVDQVVLALQENNVSRPSGIVVRDGQVLPVRTVNRYRSLEDVGNLVLSPVATPPEAEAAPEEGPALSGVEGSPVRLRDVADVRMAADPFASVSRTNGRPSLAIRVMKDPEANTVEVANNVQDKIGQMRGRLPADVQIVTIFDQSDFIEDSIDALVREGLLGALFAVLVIYVFLTGVRTTLVTAVSIPLSVLIALVVLAWQGITLNVITLAGLTVAIGRVVDDSIVVLENIYRHTRAGEKLSDAAYAATREVGTAILASTLTTVAVFAPLALVGGLVGEVFLSFAFTITVALLASLLVALTVVPTLGRFLVRVPRSRSGQRPARWEDEETWLQRLYTPALRWALRHRLITLAGGAVLFVGSFGLLPFIGVSFLPSMGGNELHAVMEFPAGTDLATTKARAQEVEQVLAQQEGLEVYHLIIGQPDPTRPSFGTFGRISGSNSINMFLRYEGGVDLDAAAQWLRDRLRGLPGDEDVSVSNIGSVQTGEVEITVSADSLDEVRAASDQLLQHLGDIEDLADIHSDLVSARPEMVVQVDSLKASAYGLSAQDISQRVRDALFGQKATQAELDGGTADIYVRVAYDSAGAEGGPLALPLAPGGVPRLGQVAQVTVADGPVQVTRIDQRRGATIRGSITSDDTSGVSAQVDDVIAAVDKGPSVEIRKGGVFEQQQQAFNSLYRTLAIAVIVVFIVMVASLGSVVNPLIILASLPFATIGSFFALFITGREIGLPAMIGFLMLIGIVVTNAIVLITFVEQLRGRGLPTREALVQGGRSRVRPILMTALATIFALIPLSLGLNEGVLVAAELATVVIGGLFTSTILTLLVIPVVYSLVHEPGIRAGR